ncbi:hypothetical protein [Rhodoplanes sp. Z2-YC6860]|uniref:hypothetical protein n=1 Tax=Rhodoplanes sp. Z2-YC6860 TaxID=674703 RepID=UPI000AF3C62A|nr:hypothetical protein [Rhodoplanes sp. Z2-YC6860]
MKFETKIFEEPHLEFGDKHHHPDPRLGLSEAGPLQIPVGDVVRIAVIGSSKTVEDAQEFFEEAAAGFQGKSEKHPNLHPAFPGLGNQNPFRCKFEIPEGRQSPSLNPRSTRSGKSLITAKPSRWPWMKSSSNCKRSMKAAIGQT